MNKRDVTDILSRFPYIRAAILNDSPEASFYVGNRKFTVSIDAKVRAVHDIVMSILASSTDPIVQAMIQGCFVEGNSDKSVYTDIPLDRSSYYVKKRGIVNKIYQCCICKGLVDYADILNDAI